MPNFSTITPLQIKKFQNFVLSWGNLYGRHQLPWRQNYNPYHILISEVMLQQTQVDRVIPYFEKFVAIFPTPKALAFAPTATVVKHWQGLGYNRRGLNLQRAAQKILTNFNGQIPSTLPHLISLPGIGPYTAAAILAFGFNVPATVIETNIRTVYIYHFFPLASKVSDQELMPLIEQTLYAKNSRLWYSALMDYGTYLKRVLPNPSRKSKTYSKQSKFEGSFRQIRGQILKILSLQDSVTETQLLDTIEQNQITIKSAVDQLEKEGFLKKDQTGNSKISLRN